MPASVNCSAENNASIDIKYTRPAGRRAPVRVRPFVRLLLGGSYVETAAAAAAAAEYFQLSAVQN